MSRSLRILAIHRYFWPDTPPYASMLRSITRRWAEEGHQVDVLSTQPSYKQGVGIERQPDEEVLDGVNVRRLDLPGEHGRRLTRITNVVRFAWAIIAHARKRGPYDIIMASTAPPVLIAGAARFAAALTGGHFVYHCMDIHPEMGRITGEFRNRIVYRLLREIDSLTCRSASRVIVLSSDMRDAIRARRGGLSTQIEIINNFNLQAFDNGGETLPKELTKTEGSFRVVFAGNIGRFQGLDIAIEAMHHLSADLPVELLLMGEGKALHDLQRRAGSLGSRVRFVPHQSVDVARALIRTADVCLVSLRPGIFRFAYPSKTMTYLAEGRPLLVSVEADSALSRFVRREGIGLVVDPGDAKGLSTAIEDLLRDPARVREMGIRASKTADAEFSSSAVLDHWSRVVSELSETSIRSNRRETTLRNGRT